MRRDIAHNLKPILLLTAGLTLIASLLCPAAAFQEYASSTAWLSSSSYTSHNTVSRPSPGPTSDAFIHHRPPGSEVPRSRARSSSQINQIDLGSLLSFPTLGDMQCGAVSYAFRNNTESGRLQAIYGMRAPPVNSLKV